MHTAPGTVRSTALPGSLHGCSAMQQSIQLALKALLHCQAGCTAFHTNHVARTESSTALPGISITQVKLHFACLVLAAAQECPASQPALCCATLTAEQPASLHCSQPGTMCLTVDANHHSMPCGWHFKATWHNSLHGTSQKAHKDTKPPCCSSGLTLTMCQTTQMTAAGEALIAATDPTSSSCE